jgi:copper chaperone NosL
VSRQTIAAVMLATLVAAGCGEANATAPPEINYGRDICAACGMIVTEPRFATAYRPAGGTEKVFDDLGDMILYGREHGELETAAVWVHDFETEEWIEASDAFYVATTSTGTPMGHGILAFSDAERAQQAATDLDGEVITWDIVTHLPVENGLLGEHHDG